MIRFLLVLSVIYSGCTARLNPFEPVDGTNQQINLPTNDNSDRKVKLISDKKEQPQQVVRENKPQIATEQTDQMATNIKKAQETRPLETKKAKETKPVEVKKPQATKTNEMSVSKETSKVSSTQTPKNVVKTDCKLETKPISKKKASIKSSKNTIKKNVVSKNYKILPLITLDLIGENLSISTRNNYKLIRYYEEPKENKFVFDFKANLGVPTERGTIKSPYYDSYIVGNHPEDGFFRVVVPVKDSVSNYKVLIKNNKGTIIRK